ncbi:alginate export family protein [Novosphingobium aquimarinum]|uniref:alginate export family protein n=1 Tax=Novosphingobium aquimarinum TaxID=2682494 RepID=UPI0012EC9E4D|nr:alginate export family protein [Novosphingobium aquimarinum]
MKSFLSVSALAAGLAIAAPCQAKAGDPIPVGDGLTFDPIIDGRLRWEHVEQDNALKDADAVTLRMRGGFELQHDSGLAFLAEAEANLAIGDRYNDTIPGNNGYLGAEPYSVVADPQTVELNRLQVAYKGKDLGLTVGRQRIVYDNARFVGDVIWRQNEQTFDAVRGTAKLGPVAIDATYAISQRTVFGIDSPNEHFDGDFILAQAGIDTHGVKLKAFTYLLDYDDRVAFSSQTFGILASTSIPLGGKTKIDVSATYARQSDYKANPVDYSADYFWGELGGSVAGFGIKGGYEELGSDDGIAAFQTPLATLHAFNGWADLFLTTPAAGLRDYYGSVGKGLGDVGPLKGLKAAVVYHKFESDVGGLDYGTEWDANLGFKIQNYGILLKYANYDAKDFGVDTEKFWLQAEFSF